MNIELSLDEAQQVILDTLSPLPATDISLSRALRRVVASTIKNRRPKPAFDQSTRDGFVIGPHDDSRVNAARQTVSWQITGELPAGSHSDIELGPGQTWRIMTGAMVPRNARRIIPFEQVEEHGDIITLPLSLLSQQDSFIRQRGCDLAENSVLVTSGEVLRPHHLLLLAEDGRAQVRVHEVPTALVLCTGSELIDPGMELKKAKKVSGNGILLAALLAEAGAACHCVPALPDRAEAIAAALEAGLERDIDLIITTGGMGPGKYDLMEQVFARLGGKVLYNRLRVRPGKATMFGLLGNVPLFALPGPPPAVRLLFHELVAPGLGKLQGRRDPMLQTTKARLAEPLTVKGKASLNLKAGVLSPRDGELWVRPAAKSEAVNTVILLPGDRRKFAVGELVDVRYDQP